MEHHCNSALGRVVIGDILAADEHLARCRLLEPDDEAVKFVEFFNSKENQTKMAPNSSYIPVTKGAADALPNQFHAAIAAMASASTWHQLFFDQTLGADVGGQFNDLALELASNEISGAEAAEILEEAVADNLR